MNGVVFTAAVPGQLDIRTACHDPLVTFHETEFASRSGLSFDGGLAVPRPRANLHGVGELRPREQS